MTSLQQFEKFRDKPGLFSISEALKLNGISILKLKKDSPTGLKEFLIEQVGYVVKSLNVGKTMNAAQIIQAVNFILEQKQHLTLDLVQAAFNNLIAGKYGKVYDRLDTQVLMDALTQAEYEIAEIKEAEYLNQKHEIMMSHLDIDPKVAAAINKVILPVEMPQKQDKPRPMSKSQVLANEIMSEFDKLHNEQVKYGIVKSSGMRFVKIKEGHLSIQEYTEIRFEEMMGDSKE
jgi:hypothetical protein